MSFGVLQDEPEWRDNCSGLLQLITFSLRCSPLLLPISRLLQKPQSGLISRVTDTVKSIVPSWLQKYFKNGDVSEEGGAVLGTEQNCLRPQPSPNGSEEGPPPLDGRDSPEPSTSNAGEALASIRFVKAWESSRFFFFLHASSLCQQPALIFCAEPTTSRASLNFHECVLSRPPLSRSHLAFPPLDVSSPNLGMASSLLSQPSTSTAPGPFSTGFSLVKEIKDNLSQHEDDNISTTSGFSSRASDKGTAACLLLAVARCCDIVGAD